MKIGNIKEIVLKMATRFKKAEEYTSESFEYQIKGLPKKHLDDFFQKRYNKNVDYDQWVGIRDELDRMGRILYEQALTIIGDTIFNVRHADFKKIEELENQLKDSIKEKEQVEKELSKYIDK